MSHRAIRRTGGASEGKLEGKLTAVIRNHLQIMVRVKDFFVHFLFVFVFLPVVDFH